MDLFDQNPEESVNILKEPPGYTAWNTATKVFQQLHPKPSNIYKYKELDWYPCVKPQLWNEILIIATEPEVAVVPNNDGNDPDNKVTLFEWDCWRNLVATALQYGGYSMEYCALTYTVPWSPQIYKKDQETDLGIAYLQRWIDQNQPKIVLCFCPYAAKKLANLEKPRTSAWNGQCYFIYLDEPEAFLQQVKSYNTWKQCLRSLLRRRDREIHKKEMPPIRVVDNPAALQAEFDQMMQNQEWVVSLDTEFAGTNPSNYKLLEIILATRNRILIIPVHAGTDKPWKSHPPGLPQNQGAVYIVDSKEKAAAIKPKEALYHVYVDAVQWVFKGTREELCTVLQKLGKQPLRLIGHSLKTDLVQLMILGVDWRPNIYVCTYDLAKTLDENQPQGLGDLIVRYLGYEDHKNELETYRKNYNLEAGSYALVPTHIRHPYAAHDAYRTLELAEAMLHELEEEDHELCRKEPSMYARGLTLHNAYFLNKIRQIPALVEMELVGHPIHLQHLKTLVDWYEDRLVDKYREVIQVLSKYVEKPKINLCSASQLSRLLFHKPPEGLHLKPLFTTQGVPWDKAMERLLQPCCSRPLSQSQKTDLLNYIHEHLGSVTFCLEDPETQKVLAQPDCPVPIHLGSRVNAQRINAAISQDTMEMFAGQHPACNIINQWRNLYTLANNYCRKAGPWGVSKIRKLMQEEDPQTLLFPDAVVEPEPDPAETEDSKVLSQVVNISNSILYTTYWGSLETHRLRTSPNISAIPKNEAQYLEFITGKPPYNIRNLECAPWGWFMVEADYTAAEVQSLAQLSEDPEMTAIMNDPSRDIHAALARAKNPDILGNLTDMEIKQKYKNLRDEAKPFTFGIPYQRGKQSMVFSLNLEAIRMQKPPKYTEKHVEELKQSYIRLFPRAWQFLEEQMNRAVRQCYTADGTAYLSARNTPGYQIGITGFRRRYLEPVLLESLLKYGDHRIRSFITEMRREASNWQIQHSVAVYIMQACYNWYQFRLQQPNFPMVLIDILHDSARWLVHWTHVHLAKKVVESVMTNIPANVNPRLRVDVNITYEWGGKPLSTYQPSPEQPRIRLEGLKYLGLDYWNDILPPETPNEDTPVDKQPNALKATPDPNQLCPAGAAPAGTTAVDRVPAPTNGHP